jgi:hypothetical protein
VHEIAQSIVPAARVLYVDNDALVMTHNRALLVSTDQGETGYAEADLRDPTTILYEARTLLDFGQPIAVLALAVLHFVPDSDQPYQHLATVLDALCPGSCLAVSHGTGAFMSAEQLAGFRAMPRESHGDMVDRHHEQILRFFDGLTIEKPGLVPLSQWLPDHDPEMTAAYAGVGRKP